MTSFVQSHYTLDEVKDILIESKGLYKGLNKDDFIAKIHYRADTTPIFIIERR